MHADARERVGILANTQQLCNDAGVALSLVKPLPKMRLSDAAWWPSPHRPIIALSARHKTDDHFWFSFFHEAVHLLLHSKRSVFVDGTNGGDNETEAEANEWAADFLALRKDWQRFIGGGVFTAARIRQFANEQGVAPGILVGRLQNQGLLPWNSKTEQPEGVAELGGRVEAQVGEECRA